MKLSDLAAAGVVPVWSGGGLLRPLTRYTAQGRGQTGTAGDAVVAAGVLASGRGPNQVAVVSGGGGPFLTGQSGPGPTGARRGRRA